MPYIQVSWSYCKMHLHKSTCHISGTYIFLPWYSQLWQIQALGVAQPPTPVSVALDLSSPICLSSYSPTPTQSSLPYSLQTNRCWVSLTYFLSIPFYVFNVFPQSEPSQPKIIQPSALRCFLSTTWPIALSSHAKMHPNWAFQSPKAFCQVNWCAFIYLTHWFWLGIINSGYPYRSFMMTFLQARFMISLRYVRYEIILWLIDLRKTYWSWATQFVTKLKLYV